MKKFFLTPAQERSIQTSLYLFEKALRKVDKLISEGDVQGILYVQKTGLDVSTGDYIHNKIATTLNELGRLVNDLGLKPYEEWVENVIMAEMSICWESLEENHSKRMRGYGVLDPRAARIIDPAIAHFAGIALELSNISTRKQSEDIIK